MKFIHLADLHLGKKLAEASLIEDQQHILNQINTVISNNKIDAVLLAGDIYDRAIPSTDAVEVLDSFLSEQASHNIPVFIISGNHDSGERLGFGRKIFGRQHIYLSGMFDGDVPHTTLKDEYGEYDIYLLPNLKINAVRRYFPDAEFKTLNDAVKAVIDSIELRPDVSNVILAHQFVMSGADRPQTSESEINSVGDLDEIDAAIFDAFDYVALGHLHGPQFIHRRECRYCGSPLKYSASEQKQKKSVTIIDLQEKGKPEITEIPLHPLRDVREIKGPLKKLISKEVTKLADTKDYFYVTLTDDVIEPNAQRKLLRVYPNLLSVRFSVNLTKRCARAALQMRGHTDLHSETRGRLKRKMMIL